jgi:hypothetical protein
MRKSETDAGQLGFDDLFKETDAINEAAAFEREFGHLPTSVEEAVPYLRSLIERHHAAMMAGNIDLALNGARRPPILRSAWAKASGGYWPGRVHRAAGSLC